MLVIGAGVAGSVAALQLARAGFDVVCLEQGGWTDPSEFPGSKPEWELLSRQAVAPEPERAAASPRTTPARRPTRT